MKVETRGGIGGPGAPKRTRPGAGGFVLAESEAAAEPAAVVAPPPAAGLAPLLALQEVDVDGPRRRKALVRGSALLDGLEALRLDLMFGRVPRERLDQLMVLLRGRGEMTADPGLAALLDEIELRAAVELAKLGF